MNVQEKAFKDRYKSVLIPNQDIIEILWRRKNNLVPHKENLLQRILRQFGRKD